MDLEKRMRMAAESILENEALRQGMEANGANPLLEWGTQCAKQIAAATADLEDDLEAEESTYPRMKALRKMMEATRKLFAPETDSSQQTALWAEITRHAPVVYGHQESGLAEIQQELITMLKGVGGEEKFRMLRALIEDNLR